METSTSSVSLRLMFLSDEATPHQRSWKKRAQPAHRPLPHSSCAPARGLNVGGCAPASGLNVSVVCIDVDRDFVVRESESLNEHFPRALDVIDATIQCGLRACMGESKHTFLTTKQRLAANYCLQPGHSARLGNCSRRGALASF